MCAVALSSAVVGCIGLSGAAAAAPVRHYEQVSPADKGLGDIVGDGLTTVAAASGDVVAFNSRAQFAGAIGSGVSGQTQYIARRALGAWSTQAITPMPRADALQTFFGATKLQLFSRDLSTALLWGYDLPAVSGDAVNRINMYLEDTATRSLQPITVSQQDSLVPFDFITETVWGVSDDARHVAFVTNTRLLPAAVAGRPNLYQWDDGALTLAGILPDDRVSPSGATVFPANYRGAMSADGSRLAFNAPAAGAASQLYLRIGGSRTVWVSQPEGTNQSTPTGVILQGLTRDGQNVFFVTTSPLLDSDTNRGPDLYRYSDSADPARDSNLTMISQDGDVAGNTVGASLIGASEDGQRVYYHTSSDTIVLWDHGSTHLISSVVSRDGNPRFQLAVTASEPGFGRVTPDGNYMAFLTSSAPDTVHGPTGEATNEHYEMYVFNRSDETLKCISCPSGGATVDATVIPAATDGNPTIDNVSFRPQFLSESGQVFFSSAESLVPQDRNGVADVYEYDAATGELSLLSTGQGRDPVMFADANPSGNDVFVVTRQRLVKSSDQDELVDLYDARVGPALPEPEIHQPSPCVGESCQPPPSAAPAEDALGSLFFEDGGASLSASGKALVARRRASFNGASGSFRLRLLAPGTLEWSGKGLRSGSTKRGRAGTARLSLRLTRRARTELGRKGRYQTTLHVTLVQAGGAEVSTATRVTFRATAKKGR